MKSARRILLIRLSSLGDILHTVPAFRSLRAAYPDAEIDWLVEKRMAFLLAAVPGISNVFSIDTHALRLRPWNLQSWKAVLDPVRRIHRRRYDVCIDFQGLFKTGVLSYLSGASTRLGFAPGWTRERPASWFYNRYPHLETPGLHVSKQNLALAEAAGGLPVSFVTDLRVEERDHQRVDAIIAERGPDEFVILNPGAGWYTKQWKPYKYGKLAERIQGELKLNVLVTTGPGEGSLYREIAEHCPSRPPIHLEVSFLQLIPLCRRARLFIGGDTGPLQLASLIGTPVVGIFGPTSPARNGPLSDRDEVVAHVLACSYCYGRTCPTQNECMDIEVDEVFDAVVRRLKKDESKVKVESR